MEGNERIVKGIWFPIEIWEAKDLDWLEKVILLEIDSFTTKGRECFMSNEYIAERFDIKEWKASHIVNDLIKKGYVICTRFDGRRRYIESNLINRVANYSGQPCEIPESASRNFKKQPIEKSGDNNYKINNDSLQNHQSNNKRFVPPTYKEVFDYCFERNNNVDAQAFVDFYTSNGWKVGNNPMKDWKAAVRTWEKRDKKKPSKPAPKNQDSYFEHNNRLMAEMLGQNFGGFNDEL